jgi:hypothetical protein
MPEAIDSRLAELPKLDRAGVSQLWHQVFDAPPPKLRRHLLISILAYRLQEQVFGSLSATSRGRLRQLARAVASDSNAVASATPSIRPGTRLVRQWGDQVHLVNVEARGYEYQGVRYQSLSEIARLITGTRWSGPLFFGLKSKPIGNKSKEAQ